MGGERQVHTVERVRVGLNAMLRYLLALLPLFKCAV